MNQSAESNKVLINKLYYAQEHQDFQGYLDCIADDVIYHAAGNCPVSGIHKGKEISMDNLLIYMIKEGKVKEVHEFIEDEARHDLFWK